MYTQREKWFITFATHFYKINLLTIKFINPMKKLFIAFMMMAVVALGFTACNQEGKASDATSNETAKPATPAADAAAANTPAKIDPNAPDPNLPKTSVEFSKSVIEFGDITQGDKVSETVTFTNTGNEPLIISSAKGSCGCTVPKWPKAPVAPGESADMTIEFSSKGKSGQQNKTVTIQANTDPNPTRLTVKGNVLVPEGAAAPAGK